ncbi:porin family protein [Hymenobacter terricola]|uniref:hypothetical protein n=1 Tax=Hymenobacter terricola TaxID=2819236 RepID=UPI001B301919|nr:hypothetical protein [Hymenobacter terricola]
MSINPIDENATPKTTGSLEELFRHHLGEEAAVPPRPMLWDQIDNSLLIRQNEIYRRRLTATRWVAAASLLLATLAGTGWWSIRDSRLGGTDMATTSEPAGSQTRSIGGNNNGATAGNSPRPNTMGYRADGATASVAAAGSANTAASELLGQRNATGSSTYSASRSGVAATMAVRRPGFGSAAVRGGLETGLATTGPNGAGTIGTSPAGPIALQTANTTTNITSQPITASATQTPAAEHATVSAAAKTAGQAFASRESATATAAASTAATNGAAAGGPLASTATAAPAASLTSAAAVVAPEQMSLLAARSAALDLAKATALPNGLAPLPLPEPEAAVDAHRWHYGASYTASVFNPNVNFSRAGIAPEYGYNPALGAGSPALTEAAATQYRQNLRPGLSQRIALLATRHLTGHWSLGTGVELSQATARSASSTAFVGEQLLDLGQSSTGPMHTTGFRYRLASIPVEVRYTNPVKRGWSLYGRLGGVVSALLGARSDVEGNPEATRTYSIASAGMPYRRVLGSLRGGAGAQFRTGTGNWALTLGPVAEIGLTSMNAHPAQSYFAQSHAYSFGLEAGMEFGR